MINKPSSDIIVATDRILQFIGQKKNLQPECCYVTVSHLYQYVCPLLIAQNYINSDFIEKSRKLFHKYMKMILSCSAIPKKEKIVFMLFANGLALQRGKKLHRIRKG